jgi:hypothetical protein
MRARVARTVDHLIGGVARIPYIYYHALSPPTAPSSFLLAHRYACAGGPAWYSRLGANNAHWMAHFTDGAAGHDGARSAQAYMLEKTPTKGGWTEDAWLDVLHNLVTFMDAGEDGVC